MVTTPPRDDRSPTHRVAAAARRALALLLATGCAVAQPPSEEELRQRRAAKLEEPFVTHVPWERSWDTALRRARDESKLVLAYFTRSYAPCPPCQVLEHGPWVSAWWKAAAREVVPYLNVTAKLADDVDAERLRTTGGTGFPHVALIDGAGAVLRIFRPAEEADFRAALAAAAELAALGAHCAAHADDRDAQVRYRIGRLRVLDDETLFQELRALTSSGSITRETRALYRAYLAHRSIVRFWNDHRDATRSLRGAEAQEAQAAWGARAHELWGQGIRPPALEMTYVGFALLVFEGALAAEDRATARAALDWARGLGEHEPRLREQLDALAKRLE